MHYLSQYQSFDNVQELNHHVKQHTNRRYHDMNETQRQVLQLISQYSVKFVGASHLRIQTIADEIGKSRRTVERAIRVLIDLNVIERLHTTRRVSGGKGANIYRILPYVASEVSHCEESAEVTAPKDNAPIVEKESAIPLNNTNNYVLESARAVKNAIPTPIYDVLSPFFSARELTRLTGVIFRAKTAKVRLEDHEEAFKTVILDCIRRHKNGAITSLDGYIYASVRRLSRRLFLAA